MMVEKYIDVRPIVPSDIPLSDQDGEIIDIEYKLAIVRDLIEAAEEQGME